MSEKSDKVGSGSGFQLGFVGEGIGETNPSYARVNSKSEKRE